MIQIIPAIDLLGGKCVRLKKGRFDRTSIYLPDPVDLARTYAGQGFRRLHLVDLDGAKTGRPANLEVLEKICSSTPLSVDFGGGLREIQDLEAVFAAGASQATLGSLAVSNPGLVRKWMSRYGAHRFILAADARKGKVAVSGWTRETGTTVHEFIHDWKAAGVEEFLCTDIDRDGMLRGPSLVLYRTLAGMFPGTRIIASGGVSSITDLVELNRTGVHGVVVGKALLEGKIRMDELKAWMD